MQAFVDDILNAKNVDDVWKARIDFDKFTPTNVKDATELSPIQLQNRKAVWSEVRNEVNKFMDESVDGFNLLDDFKVLSGLFDAASNIVEKSPKLIRTKGIFSQRDVLGTVALLSLGSLGLSSLLRQ